jgi:tRNA threonylcarbamoyladenosine biosynthesis protein TsaB
MASTGGPAASRGPVILALDTTTRAGSIAVFRAGGVEDVLIGDAARSHGERLPGDIGALLDRTGLRPADVDLFAVVAGPGSFTGLRVGIAAIQGLALAEGKKVVAVPALEAFAASTLVPEGRVGVWMDAQRQQVFAASYDKRPDGELLSAEPPVSWTPDQVTAAWEQSGVRIDTLVGDGIDLYKARVQSTWPFARLVTPAPPLAPIAALLAASRPHLARAPHAIVPIYVRVSDAEMARDRGAGKPRP